MNPEMRLTNASHCMHCIHCIHSRTIQDANTPNTPIRQIYSHTTNSRYPTHILLGKQIDQFSHSLRDIDQTNQYKRICLYILVKKYIFLTWQQMSHLSALWLHDDAVVGWRNTFFLL